AATVYHTKRIPELIGTAFRQAYNGRPGPVFLEIPRDVLDASVDETAVVDPSNYRSRGKVYGDFKLVEQAARLLTSAERPAVLAGSQVWQCRGVAELQAFVEAGQAPVYLNGAARGALPATHPCVFNRSRREALARADVILV